MRPRPTIRDVARVAGVSHATVSRHLNGHTNVARRTAEAIDAAVLEANYVPNGNARSLVRRKSFTVALVVREHIDLFYADPNLSRMAAGANSVLSANGYVMPLMLVDSDVTATRVVDMIRGGSVDGALLIAMETNDQMVRALRGTSTPLVTASIPLADDSLTWVDTDNVGGTQTITDILRRTGRTRIAEIRGPAAMPVSRLRHEGFVAAMGQAYDPTLVVDATQWSYDAGAQAMRVLLDRDAPPDGIVAASDLLAAGAMSVLAERGLDVPDDVAVVGFDDSPIAIMSTPQISTVRQESATTGKEMAKLMLAMLNGEQRSGSHITVPSVVVWRDSAGPAPAQHATE